MPSDLDFTSRVRIASMLYKLAIRMQQTSKRTLDSTRVMSDVDSVANGAFSWLLSHFTPAVGAARGKSPRLAKSTAHRTEVPGHGSGMRVSFLVGPLHMVQSPESVDILTSASIRNPSARSYSNSDSLDAMETMFASKLGGISPSINVVTRDIRPQSVSTSRYRMTRDFQDGKRVWVILDNETGEPAWYTLTSSEAQGSADPYRKAVFPTSQEATREFNKMTVGTRHKSVSLPKFEEKLLFVRYSAVYLEKHLPSDVGAGIYSVLSPMLPQEKEERSLEMEKRLQDELAQSKARTQEESRLEQEKTDSARSRAFDFAGRRR